jgi:outer membrane lipoprotein carrier protein
LTGSRWATTPTPLHESTRLRVNLYVIPRLAAFVPALALLAVASAPPADIDIPKLLKGIDEHYNHARTLEVGFSETYTAQGRSRTESGELFLRKPGRMRWQYAEPAGKLFISDGKYVYLYSPDTNRAEKMKLKATEDLRAPMAFLLGHLDLKKDFRNFDAKQQAGGVFVTADAKNDQMPYTKVAFLVGPESRIQKLIVTGQDQSVLDFSFNGEKMNPPVNNQMFIFQVPKGAEYVDSTQSVSGER